MRGEVALAPVSPAVPTGTLFAQAPPGVWAALVVTPLIVAGGQILFKLAAARLETVDPAGYLRLAFEPIMIAALVLYGLGTLIWVSALKFVPLTIAYPFMALTFCAVPAFSALWLGETVDLRYALGVVTILTGLGMILTR